MILQYVQSMILAKYNAHLGNKYLVDDWIVGVCPLQVIGFLDADSVFLFCIILLLKVAGCRAQKNQEKCLDY